MRVRRIRAHEWEPYRALRLRALADAPSAFSSTHAEEAAKPDDFWRERAESAATSDDKAMFVAEVDGEWLGLGGCLLVDDKGEGRRPGWVVSMWVDPRLRRRGAAAAMVGALAAWAGERGVDVLNLYVTESNAPAVALYERLGFVRHGPSRPLAHTPTMREVQMVLPLGSDTSI